MLKKIHFIVNPAAGNDEPILSWINDAMCKTKIEWEVKVTKTHGDARRFAKEAIHEKVDAVAVYGGDGSVMEVAEALFQTDVPIAIIPGGTANVMAKELSIPVDTRAAINLLVKGYKTKMIDMALCNDKPFVIRINAGLLADMVEETPRDAKDSMGQIAYAITALKQISQTDQVQYEMVLDGKKKKVHGVALVIANSGNVGITGLSLFPTIDIADGYLDVLVFKTKQMGGLLKWAANVVTGTMPDRIVRHWKVREASITINPKQTIILDDRKVRMSELSVKVVPKALKVLVPR